MKKALMKDLFREIYRSKSRFLAIMAIVAIGSGFFAGVKSSCPDMKMTAAAYYDEYNLADFHIMSNYGLDDDDIKAIKNTVDVRGIKGGYSADVMVKNDDNNMELKAISYNVLNPDTEDNINRPMLVDGRLPEKSGECAVVESKLANGELAIGSKIQLYLEKGDISEELKVTEFEIVGTINTPNYVGFQYGNTTIGDGELDSYILIPEEDFAYDVYTDVYFTLSQTEGLDPFEQEYMDIIKENTTLLEENKELSYGRYNSIVAEAQEELDDAKQELADGEEEAAQKLEEGWQELEDARIQFKDAKTQIDDARKELDDGWSEYYSGVETLNNEIAKGRQQIADAKAKLSEAEKEYNEGLELYNQGLSEFQEKEAEALEEIAGYEAQLAELEPVVVSGREELESFKSLLNNYNSIIEKYAEISVTEEEIPAEEISVMEQIDAFISEMMPGVPISIKSFFISYATAQTTEEKQQYSAILGMVTSEGQKQIDEKEAQVIEGEEAVALLKAGIEEGYRQLDEGRQELENTKNMLDEAKRQIDEGYSEIYSNESLLNQKEAEGKAELQEALNKLYSGESEYESGVAEYESGLQEYQDGLEEYRQAEIDAEEELQEGRDKIADAEKELRELETPEWYIFDRNDNQGYSTYKEDAEKVDAIAAVFPFFFVLVAALVCSTTMARMVEEQRTQMGTLKALGYDNRSIVSKYLLYAIGASIVGSIIGLCIGFKLFPSVIINAYKIMYSMPDPMMPFRWDYAGWCTLVGILCTGLSAYFVCRRELKTVPAQLMRPKSPKQGKKIFLERIGFIWKKLSFSRKVTARNIFRYKSRTLMTTIGVAGCCALILTGFGLNYAITSIVDRQFEEIFVYDITIAVSEDSDIEQLQEYIDNDENIIESMALMSKTVDVKKPDGMISVSLVVPKDYSHIENFVTLRTMDKKTPLELSNDGAIINEKLSKVLGVKSGDTMTIQNSNGSSTEIKVSGVTENYAMNYIYMTPEYYGKLYNDNPEYNMFYANIPEGVKTEDLSRKLLDNEDILGVAYSSDIMGRFIDTIGSLKSIVLVLIVSAGLLAFIVMYNLMNINVNERKRELATIKVLGFYDREVSAYIYRENNVAVLLGIIAGLIGGIFLEKFVVTVAEVDVVMFISDMAWWCYVVSALITALFAVIVTIVVHFTLKKIDMVESLKAIE